MSPRPEDTSAASHRFQLLAYRRSDPVEKLRCVASLNRSVRALAAAGVRRRHGSDLSDREVALRVAALSIPAPLLRAAFGWDPAERDR